VNVVTVFAVALVSALATGLGALPLYAFRALARTWLALASALAAGFMAGASAGLFIEGGRFGVGQTALGAGLGVAFILLTRRRLGAPADLHVGALRGADARKAIMIVGVMTVHSFTEGVGIGVSFGGGDAFGLLISTAIAVHNVPEGLAIALVLVPRGVGVGRAAAWGIFSSLPQPLMAVPAYLLVEWFEPFLPLGLGFAGGAMTWMVAVELIPEARSELTERVVFGVIAGAGAAMLALQFVVLS
jgi:zinc transporter ZupT